jgi:hypothetical protein
MKLKTLRSFSHIDQKTGRLMVRKKETEFIMDETAQGEEIFSLLGMGRVTIIDDSIVPKTGRYLCLYGFPYETAEAFLRSAQPGAEVSLPRETAVRLLVSGHIKPIDEDGWTPRKLLGPILKEDKIKKMFDDPVPEKEPWVQKGMR